MSHAHLLALTIRREFHRRSLKRIATLILTTAIAAALSIQGEKQAECADRGRVPNIVLILADDKN